MVHITSILFSLFLMLNFSSAEEVIEAELKYQAIPDKAYTAVIEKVTKQGIKITQLESRDPEGVIAKGPFSHSVHVNGYNSDNESVALNCDTMAVFKKPVEGEKAEISKLLVVCKADE